MRPIFAGFKIRNMLSNDPIFFSYFSMTFLRISNFFYLFFCQFYCWMSSFFNHINSVFFVCSKKEMRRSNTIPNVAFMKYIFTVWYSPKMDHPRKPMNINKFLTISNMPIIIRFTIHRSGPKPTFTCFSNFIKETFFQWWICSQRDCSPKVDLCR